MSREGAYMKSIHSSSNKKVSEHRVVSTKELRFSQSSCPTVETASIIRMVGQIMLQVRRP